MIENTKLEKKIAFTFGKIKRTRLWLDRCEKAVNTSIKKDGPKKKYQRQLARIALDRKELDQCEQELKEINHTVKARKRLLKE